MASLAHQRCFHHSLREAVARCTECRQFYCRECITEHEERIICASCLRKMTAASATREMSFRWLGSATACVVGFAAAWFFFYMIGAMLLSIPSSYHEGTVWTDRWWNAR